MKGGQIRLIWHSDGEKFISSGASAGAKRSASPRDSSHPTFFILGPNHSKWVVNRTHIIFPWNPNCSLRDMKSFTGWPICIQTVVVRAIDTFFLTFSSRSLYTNVLALFWCILSHFSPILSDRWLKIMFCENQFQALVLLFSSYLVNISNPKSYNFWSK